MAERGAATMKDVAQLAQVSISTVSHVVNQTRRVEAPTRERILAAIKELDFKPNQLARGLRGAGSKTIGLIISDIREDYFAELTKSIETAAIERGYMVILCDSEEDSAREATYLDILANRGVDGIIVAPVSASVDLTAPKAGLPMVQVDRKNESLASDFVGIDNERWAGEAVRHLVAAGRRSLGFVGLESEIATMAERREGFESGTRREGIAGSCDSITLTSALEDPRGSLRDWLAAHPGLDALVCGNANLCYLACETIPALGLAIPDDIAILSFDDPRSFSLMRTPITAIRQPTEELGLAALDCLLARIGGGPATERREVILPATLVVRESCGMVSGGAVHA